ncbi:hypothetical protein DFP72DRAFT_857330 [Ephemerocybe angulata]|uniref:Uncharacterized protein n=1 Tax=Ephemerocybe angulata TaxID=980116 RepID=A0A8H6LUS5_9AGAR|nr:hypothetical protein DFP72DRAFT_857330 [Tulosesus angulatus]
MPDILSMFKKPSPVGKKGGRRKNTIMSSDDDSMDDLPSKSRKGKGKGKKPVMSDDDQRSSSSGYHPRSAKGGPQPPRAKRKNNKRARATPMSDEEDDDRSGVHEPSAATLATWSRGDDDMEASTKMTALVTFLKEWDASGDKVICYSQCRWMVSQICVLVELMKIVTRDFDVGLARDFANATWSTESSVRWKDGPKTRDHTLQAFKKNAQALKSSSSVRKLGVLAWTYLGIMLRNRSIRSGESVYVKRLVVENTIEERMLKLQRCKDRTASPRQPWAKGPGGKLHKLSCQRYQIRRLTILDLFGITPAAKEAAKKANERGRWRLEVEKPLSNMASPEPSSD